MSATNTKAPATKIIQFRARSDDQRHITEIRKKLKALGVSATVTDAIRHALQVAPR